MEKIKKQRIEWIDIAKGLSIILVVYGHCGLAAIPSLADWFGAFRMPFFFFVSGILFSPDKYPTYKSFVAKRYKTLYRPFFIFSAVVAVGYILIYEDWPDRLLNVVKFGWGGYALWFIPVLCLTEICYFIICRNFIRLRYRIIVILTASILGWVSYKLSFFNPHNLWFSLTAVLFYGFGNIFGKKMSEYFKQKSSLVICVFAIVFLSVSFTYMLNGRPEFGANNMATPYTYPAAFGGLLMMCCIAELISRHTPKALLWSKRMFIAAGKNSYIILAFHQIIILLLGAFVIIPWGSLTRLVMWLILAVLIVAINRYCPQILGRTYNK